MTTSSLQKGALFSAVAAAAILLMSASREVPAPQQVQPPVGSVIAFAGEQPPPGWLVADGRALRSADYPELYQVIRTAHGAGLNEAGTAIGDFNLPDYRGMFLRGVDISEQGTASGRDPEADRRSAPRRGTGNNGNRVGSVQEDATRMPRTPFAVTPVGDHTHRQQYIGQRDCCLIAAGFGPGNQSNRDPEEARVNTQPAGGHGHALTGGDAETRPRNAAVFWIIRVR